MTANTNQPPSILLTGATGYIGGRLLRRLKEEGCRVRCLTRRPESLEHRRDASTEIVPGDAQDRDSLIGGMRGIETAYYLVHSMGADDDFESIDRQAAENFAAAAKICGVRRIIYVGGLGDEREALSPHLRSRHEVGRILRSSGVPVIELRASIVIGSGSLSFEMIRSLVERLPFMITPRWVDVKAQPIAIEDLLSYLIAALRLPDDRVGIYEVGGRDQVCYADIMREYARQRGLPARMFAIPFLTPYLSSLWLGLITPLYARIGRKLIESVIHPTIVRDPAASQVFAIQPMGIEKAIARAIALEENEYAETRWSDALSSAGEPRAYGGVRFGNRLVDSHTIRVAVPATRAFAVIESIGGNRGWFAWNVLWQLRGALDMLVGGVGMRRGRPHPERLVVGDPVDVWRVEALEPGRRLRLFAEMKLPGRAWLELEVKSEGESCVIRQTAIFDPVGATGLAYWYALVPLHVLVFNGMLRGIAKAATQAPQQDPPRHSFAPQTPA